MNASAIALCMRILLTGAAGFIGSHVSEALVARGHHVVGLDSFDDYLYPAARKRQNARVLAQLPETSFELVEGNITDPATVARVLTASTDVVCHLAALAGVRPSLAEPLRYMRTNVEGTAVILEQMRAVGCKRLAFASSSSVYGARPGEVRGFREDDVCVTPASPYAATKRMGELLLSTYRDLYGLGAHALRFFTVYGPRQRPDMAIAKFIQAIAANQPITLFGDGTSRRDYTYIDDIVAGVVASIEGVQPGELTTLNLGGNTTWSLRELVDIIQHALGRTAEIRWQPEQPGDVPVTFADITQATTRLGYAPRVTVPEGVARFWAWHQTQAR